MSHSPPYPLTPPFCTKPPPYPLNPLLYTESPPYPLSPPLYTKTLPYPFKPSVLYQNASVPSKPSVLYQNASVPSKTLRVLPNRLCVIQLVEEGRVKVHDLATQRRMRPEIADLIRPAVYPNLKDAPRVESYPSVKGMRRNLFFWDHTVKEDESGTIASSKTNRWVMDGWAHAR